MTIQCLQGCLQRIADFYDERNDPDSTRIAVTVVSGMLGGVGISGLSIGLALNLTPLSFIGAAGLIGSVAFCLYFPELNQRRVAVL